MTRVRTNMIGWTEEQKTEHRAEKNRQKSRKWRAENTEKHQSQVKEWQRNNHDKIAEYQTVRSARQTERLQNDPEFADRRRGQWRNWARENQEARNQYKYERLYGITHAQRDARLIELNYECEICHRDIKDSFHTDHHHGTGKFRGFLCSNCNTAIGLAQENPEILRAAVIYLETH